MIVGMAISQLVEPAGKGMKFDLEEVETEEAQWYMSLTKVEDKVGSLEGLRNHRKKSDAKRSPRKPKSLLTPSPLPSRLSQAASGQTSKVIAIEEISDDDLETEDDVVPYDKPDTDASDSEEDPTLIQRSKPTSPV
jgi:telomere length regulation protein